jgi:hypothetical protein
MTEGSRSAKRALAHKDSHGDQQREDARSDLNMPDGGSRGRGRQVLDSRQREVAQHEQRTQADEKAHSNAAEPECEQVKHGPWA